MEELLAKLAGIVNSDSEDGISSLLSSIVGGDDDSGGSSLPFDPIALISIVSAFNESKDNSDVILLKAIKPYLSNARSPKVDEAIKIMQIVSIWPTIRESGLLNSFFSDR